MHNNLSVGQIILSIYNNSYYSLCFTASVKISFGSGEIQLFYRRYMTSRMHAASGTAERYKQHPLHYVNQWISIYRIYFLNGCSYTLGVNRPRIVDSCMDNQSGPPFTVGYNRRFGPPIPHITIPRFQAIVGTRQIRSAAFMMFPVTVISDAR